MKTSLSDWKSRNTRPPWFGYLRATNFTSLHTIKLCSPYHTCNQEREPLMQPKPNVERHHLKCLLNSVMEIFINLSTSHLEFFLTGIWIYLLLSPGRPSWHKDPFPLKVFRVHFSLLFEIPKLILAAFFPPFSLKIFVENFRWKHWSVPTSYTCEMYVWTYLKGAKKVI